jgi:putative CocE/NonD family hydrolase
MFTRSFFFLLLALSSFSFAQINDSTWVCSNYTKREVSIKMRDGIKLFTAIYEPKDKSEKHPILMVRTPYSCAPYGEKNFSTRLYKTYWKDYLRAGYILVMQDVRGRYMSEGVYEDVRPFIKNKKSKKDIDESTDAYDAIDWLVKNVKDNNGNVGVFGISYPGFYATMAAASNHPNLKAVSPQAPVTEWFMGDDFHHNGCFAMMDAFSFYYSFGMPRPAPTTTSAPGFTFPNKDNYEFYLSIGAIKNFEPLFKDSIRFWKQLFAHPNYDSFWQDRDARRACQDIKPAVMVVGGLFDAEDCYGAWNLYKAIKKQTPQTTSFITMGPWVHGGWSRGEGTHLGNVRFGSKTSTYYQQNIEEKFFDQYLRGKTSATKQAPANIFFTGENNWHSLEAWPPSNAVSKPLYLGEKETLSFNKPTNTNSFSKYTSDPNKPVPYTEDVHLGRTREYMIDDQRFASRRPDVLTFKTEVLTEDVTVGGAIKAFIKTAISTTDIDLIVKLIDVFPDNFAYDTSVCCKGVAHEVEMAGYQMLVRGEIMRGRFRNSFEKPEAFTPNKVEDVNFELPDVAHTFKKGHRIMVQIQSSWFPLFDRNPQQFVNPYTCDNKDFISSDVKVFHDQTNASYIELPIIKY